LEIAETILWQLLENEALYLLSVEHHHGKGLFQLARRAISS